MLIEVVLIFGAALVVTENCGQVTPWLGSCEASVAPDGEQVVLEGEQSNGSGGGNGGANTPQPEPVDPDDEACGIRIDVCQITVTAPVTLADIAAFRPSTASHGMQPDGWAVIGLPTNFYSSGSAVIDTGTLLGQPAEVRFTPVGWSWNYGDGSSSTTATPGRRWTASTEFSPSATTHVFEQRGTYTITLTVQYRAEWRVAGGPWVAVSGILSLPAPPQQVLVTGARTVLVDEDCVANPAGPGC